MRFGYVWIGANAPTEKKQRAMLTGAARMRLERAPARVERDKLIGMLRAGDQLCIASAVCAADSVVELHQVLAAVAAKGAALWVADLGEAFQGSDAMARITEDFQTTRHHEQTKAAREKLKKLPKGKRGGRPAKPIPEGREEEFDALWSVKDNSKRFVARQFETTTKVVDRWAEERGLPSI